MGFLSKVFGAEAPRTAQLRQTDFQEEQLKSVRGNIDALPEIEELTSRTNRFRQDQANQLIESAIPGFSNLQQRFVDLSENLLDTAFDLPPEVAANIERKAAERGVSVGGRGQFGEFSLLRDLGVNSLEFGMRRQQQALNTFQSIVASSPMVNPISPQNFFVTPQQQADLTFNQNQLNQQIEQSANNAEAAASNQLFRNIVDTGFNIAGMATGNVLTPRR